MDKVGYRADVDKDITNKKLMKLFEPNQHTDGIRIDAERNVHRKTQTSILI